ncbi:MAG: restriction endonuclease [Acidobacteriota bacterium]
MDHAFTKTIKEILAKNLGDDAEAIFDVSEILKYINIKTKSATRGSKSRGSFANLYAIYVLVEDYLANGFDKSDKYSDYEGAVFTALLKRQRELPFGQKLQNHALNHRLNEEFKKYFPTSETIPILRTSNRYWFNENMLKVEANGNEYNLAQSIIEIIDAYIGAKKDAFDQFIEFCEQAQKLDEEGAAKFITDLLKPTVDARIFEIVSYSILKYYYHNQTIFWGYDLENIQEDNLKLYKTGRTNANDGGIDFVMKPLGRFFQVTETVDVKKYFLDIDKIERFPITFVVKSLDSVDDLRNAIKEQAEKQFSIKAIVQKYMDCIEEIINVPVLLERFREAVGNGFSRDILNEIIKQSKVEFNYDEGFEGEIAEAEAEAEAEAVIAPPLPLE